MVPRPLLSIGHSNHELARLIELLRYADVTAVADVRSQPYSQWLPHFNRPEFSRALEDQGIAYGFFGDRLGGRPHDPALYDADGRVDYRRVRRTPAFQSGLDDLCRALEESTVAMLCSEEDPLVCHRGLMIAPALVERGIAPAHIRGDGTLETSARFEDRLLAETGVGAGILDGLFAATVGSAERERILDEAYQTQARRKAYRIRPEEPADSPERI
jgi:uncharacterized protein (DUF488 family)